MYNFYADGLLMKYEKNRLDRHASSVLFLSLKDTIFRSKEPMLGSFRSNASLYAHFSGSAGQDAVAGTARVDIGADYYSTMVPRTSQEANEESGGNNNASQSADLPSADGKGKNSNSRAASGNMIERGKELRSKWLSIHKKVLSYLPKVVGGSGPSRAPKLLDVHNLLVEAAGLKCFVNAPGEDMAATIYASLGDLVKVLLYIGDWSHACVCLW